ncbi:MAG: hypothetical protein LJE96_08035 [Deltaproteobacteria bacterium]|nr:hypothetical protein [Deltaproteobacteria bacterium]
MDPDDMTDSQREKVFKTQIFARVSPEQKLHLIKLMQEKGYTVAITGNGNNDIVRNLYAAGSIVLCAILLPAVV